ncbi:MAG: hypothetical protein ABIE43_04895 [Patescibacteria group bacterium]
MSGCMFGIVMGSLNDLLSIEKFFKILSPKKEEKLKKHPARILQGDLEPVSSTADLIKKRMILIDQKAKEWEEEKKKIPPEIQLKIKELIRTFKIEAQEEE